MQKKFAYFVLAETVDQIPFRFSWISKMPKKMMNRYILKKNPIVQKEVSILGIEGYEVQLPILQEEAYEKSAEELRIIMEQSIESLYENDVEIISMPDVWKYTGPIDMKVADGSEVTPFFVFMGIEKVLELTRKSLKYVDITVIDGKDKKTNFIIDYLYPNVNFLTVVTDEPDRFAQKVKQIYGDVGLNLQVISKARFRNTTSDIIINLYPEPDTIFYHLKRGAIYFDFTSKPENIKNILLKRQDILVIDDFLLQQDAQYISSTFCEMAWFVGNINFRKYILYEYKQDMLQSILTLPNQYDLSVVGLRQYGKTLHNTQLKQWIDKFVDEG